jgi:hypothetical protein
VGGADRLCADARASYDAQMAKLLALILLAAMALHLIKPLGLPGLKRRGDVWKLAIVAFAGFMLAVLAQHLWN